MILLWPNRSMKKFVSISKTLAASIDNVPFTTHGIKTNEKSLFFNPADGTEISSIIKSLKNHKSPGLDGLTAEILKVSHCRNPRVALDPVCSTN